MLSVALRLMVHTNSLDVMLEYSFQQRSQETFGVYYEEDILRNKDSCETSRGNTSFLYIYKVCIKSLRGLKI